jgi:hypothetical protein
LYAWNSELHPKSITKSLPPAVLIPDIPLFASLRAFRWFLSDASG